ncbi:MAG: glycosyltransferase [Acidobacteriota bacterium]
MSSEVSVVVPSYNHARFVERTLRSIFAQTRRPKKLIVIDDGSKDESAAIIESVLKDSPVDTEFRVRPNRGLSSTLNEAFALTDTEFFAYIGSDDVWMPEFLEKQVALLESRPKAVLAFSHAYLIDADDRIIDRTDNWTEFADGEMLPLLLRGQIFSSPGVLYRRSAIERHRWNDDSILEDYELYLKLSAGGEFARNRNVLCGWRQHGSNVSGDFPQMMDEWIAAQNRVADSLNITREELDEIQKRLRFESVAGFVRSGNRAKAFKLFRENLGGAVSVQDAASMLFRLAVPRVLFDWNRRRKLNAAVAKYGRLEL